MKRQVIMTRLGTDTFERASEAVRDSDIKLHHQPWDDNTLELVQTMRFDAIVIGFPGPTSELRRFAKVALAGRVPVKVNAVIQRGVNEGEILPLVRMAREEGVIMRFIEYMDVGETNGWKMKDVVSAKEILDVIGSEFPLARVDPNDPGEVAKRFRLADGSGEIGIISSVTQPFCSGCQRLRLSAEGKLYTCLFAATGTDVKEVLRDGSDDDAVRRLVQGVWGARTDRYSEERGKGGGAKAEMSYLGG